MKIRRFELEDCDLVFTTIQRKGGIEAMQMSEFSKVRYLANNFIYGCIEEYYGLDSKEARQYYMLGIPDSLSGIPECLQHNGNCDEIRFDIIRDLLLRDGFRIAIIEHELDGDTIRTTYGYEREETINLIKRTCDLDGIDDMAWQRLCK